MRKSVIVAVSSLLFSPAMAIAQTAQQAPQAQQPAAKGPDPNEVVCQRIEETGSRIASKRVCMTRSQWADQERTDQQEIQRVQTQRGCTKNGC
jgi:hypothetical protein